MTALESVVAASAVLIDLRCPCILTLLEDGLRFLVPRAGGLN